MANVAKTVIIPTARILAVVTQGTMGCHNMGYSKLCVGTIMSVSTGRKIAILKPRAQIRQDHTPVHVMKGLLVTELPAVRNRVP